MLLRYALVAFALASAAACGARDVRPPARGPAAAPSAPTSSAAAPSGAGAADGDLAACDRGVATACTRAAFRLETPGRATARVVALLQRACDLGDPKGCGSLGALYMFGNGVARDVDRARALTRRGCYDDLAKGDTAGGPCGSFASILLAVDEVTPGAVAETQSLCDRGRLDVCAVLGVSYVRGARGLPANEPRGLALLERACAGGGQAACGDLGFLLVARAADVPRGVDLLTRTCDAGAAPACVNLGGMYALGEGVGRDDARALALFGRACAGTTTSGCGGLGRMYAEGRGVPRDEARALGYYQRGCDGGDPKACLKLAVALESGRGAPAEPARARAYYDLACGLREQPACDARARLDAGGAR